MKTLDEIKDEVAEELGFGRWGEFCDDEYFDDIIMVVARRFAEERLAKSKETISSLKGQIQELQSEITILKALKRENN